MQKWNSTQSLSVDIYTSHFLSIDINVDLHDKALSTYLLNNKFGYKTLFLTRYYVYIYLPTTVDALNKHYTNESIPRQMSAVSVERVERVERHKTQV